MATVWSAYPALCGPSWYPVCTRAGWWCSGAFATGFSGGGGMTWDKTCGCGKTLATTLSCRMTTPVSGFWWVWVGDRGDLWCSGGWPGYWLHPPTPGGSDPVLEDMWRPLVLWCWLWYTSPNGYGTWNHTKNIQFAWQLLSYFLTHSTMGNMEVILAYLSNNFSLFIKIILWSDILNFSCGECHKTLLMITQYWIR